MLLRHFVVSPFRVSRVTLPSSGHQLNTIFFGDEHARDGDTLVMTHGFGSGSGMFFENFDQLLEDKGQGGDRAKSSGSRAGGRKFTALIAVDWLGMGLSDRPSRFPLRSAHGTEESRAKSSQDSVNFFVDSFHEFAGQVGLLREGKRFHLLGHSLGGYLSAQYALKHPDSLASLTLASPAGLFPAPAASQRQASGSSSSGASCLFPSDAPRSMRILDTLWKSNLTPQDIVRTLGRGGPGFTRRIVAGRFGNRWKEYENSIISDYLFHVSSQPASGEYALNSLLHPVFVSRNKKETDLGTGTSGVYARNAVGDRLGDLWIGDKRVHKDFCLNIMFGDRDWLSHPLAPQLVHTLNRKQARIGQKSKHAAQLDILPNSGHHLYLDNMHAFNESVLSVLN